MLGEFLKSAEKHQGVIIATLLGIIVVGGTGGIVWVRSLDSRVDQYREAFNIMLAFPAAAPRLLSDVQDLPSSSGGSPTTERAGAEPLNPESEAPSGTEFEDDLEGRLADLEERVASAEAKLQGVHTEIERLLAAHPDAPVQLREGLRALQSTVAEGRGYAALLLCGTDPGETCFELTDHIRFTGDSVYTLTLGGTGQAWLAAYPDDLARRRVAIDSMRAILSRVDQELEESKYYSRTAGYLAAVMAVVVAFMTLLFLVIEWKRQQV